LNGLLTQIFVFRAIQKLIVSFKYSYINILKDKKGSMNGDIFKSQFIYYCRYFPPNVLLKIVIINIAKIVKKKPENKTRILLLVAIF